MHKRKKRLRNKDSYKFVLVFIFLNKNSWITLFGNSIRIHPDNKYSFVRVAYLSECNNWIRTYQNDKKCLQLKRYPYLPVGGATYLITWASGRKQVTGPIERAILKVTSSSLEIVDNNGKNYLSLFWIVLGWFKKMFGIIIYNFFNTNTDEINHNT